MDPIEIFELYGYVVEASATNPELAVNATEIRSYVVQQARARNVVFTSELRCYIVQTGKPSTGVSVKTSTAYIVTSEPGTNAMNRANTERAHKNRRPGVFVADHVMVAIEPDPSAAALKSSVRLHDPGLMHMATTVYTIEVP